MDELTGPAKSGRPVVLAFTAFVLASRVSGSPVEEPVAGSIEGPDRVTVSRALGIALEKLRSPACRQIFGEFFGPGSASLEEVLRERGETPGDRLRRMRFLDGSRHRLCGAPGVSAVMGTGSLEVFVCGSFGASARRDPSGAANLLIHEVLHSLGAGEAPTPGLPSSEEITAHVASRCGR